MEVIEVKEDQREEWNNFVKTSPNSSLLQSWQWGQFQQSLGRRIWRLAIQSEKEWLILALVVKHNLPLGKSYLYCPRGPILSNYKFQITNSKLLFDKIQGIAEKENSIFLRIDPAIQPTTIKDLDLIKTSKEIQPQDTLILDITKSEDELMSQMHYKTRYNIRLAKRKGVKIRQSIDLKDLDIFWDLLSETTKREKFKPHSKEYYKKQLEVLGKESLIKLFLARYKGKVIAANIVSFFGDTATYLHGASLYEYRKVMAPHLLQWEAILEAKKKGCRCYDFWGIAPKDSPNHPWVGITRFKKGFGGEEIHYIGAWDKIYQPGWYRLYNLTKRIL